MHKLHVFLAVLGILMLSAAQQALAKPAIIGAPKCKACHKAKTGDQWNIWAESAHARAFTTLASEQSREIAADLGLGDPQKETACLKCHATKASMAEGVLINGRADYADTEGVGCEACHGPGSDYKARKVMADPETARAAGLVMISGEDGCTKCHNDQSPTFKGFDFEARWAEIAHPVPTENEAETSPSLLVSESTMQEIVFESSIGYVIFPHDLHATDVGMECVKCHHQIHASELNTPHPDYLAPSRINCEICHNPNSRDGGKYYRCSDCHHSELNNITDETLSSKAVIHKNCWSCHEMGTGANASARCDECHVKRKRVTVVDQEL